MLAICLAACLNGADVVFALDASDSVGFVDFQLMTHFVGMVIQTLDIDSVTSGPTISRVGLIIYSDSPVLKFNLNRYTTKAALLQAVNVPYLTGSTNTAQTIRFTIIVTNHHEYYRIVFTSNSSVAHCQYQGVVRQG